MKAIIKSTKAKGLQLAEVEIPTPRFDEVLIKIERMAICGTDLHIFEWDEWAQQVITVPRIIGHEFVGKVVGLGEYSMYMTRFRLGDRVVGEGHIVCGQCRHCSEGKRHLCSNTQGLGVQRDGAFAEYITLPYFNVYRIPPSLTDDVGSILDPFGNAVHSALEFDLIGEDVLITGAGPIGMMSVAVCRFVGARHVVITDVNDYRLALAEQFGATRVVNIQKTELKTVAKELGMVEGFDVGLELSGNPAALRSMLDAMAFGGKIAYLGIPAHDFAIDWHPIIFKSLQIHGIYGRKMFETWYKGINMLQSGLVIDPVITHHCQAEDFNTAFELLLSGMAAKVVLQWDS